jgi:hypothetical protein
LFVPSPPFLSRRGGPRNGPRAKHPRKPSGWRPKRVLEKMEEAEEEIKKEEEIQQ